MRRKGTLSDNAKKMFRVARHHFASFVDNTLFIPIDEEKEIADKAESFLRSHHWIKPVEKITYHNDLDNICLDDENFLVPVKLLRPRDDDAWQKIAAGIVRLSCSKLGKSSEVMSRILVESDIDALMHLVSIDQFYKHDESDV